MGQLAQEHLGQVETEWVGQNAPESTSLAERLIDEKYNMELALRFLVLSQLAPNDVKGLQDFGEFITEKMVEIAKNPNYDRLSNENVFRNTFKLLDDVLGEMSFKKFALDKERFEGKFLIASFESIAIGLGKNIEAWNAIQFSPEVQTNLTDKIKSIWANPLFQAKYGSGVNVTSRVPHIVPLGTEILVP